MYAKRICCFALWDHFYFMHYVTFLQAPHEVSLNTFCNTMYRSLFYEHFMEAMLSKIFMQICWSEILNL